MITTAELMANRERSRIKAEILRNAVKCPMFADHGGIRSTLTFPAKRDVGTIFFNGYSPAEAKMIVDEITLEVVNELLEDLTETRNRLTNGSEK